MVIATYVDTIMEKVLKRLGVELPDYSKDDDPTKQAICELEWTIPQDLIKQYDVLYKDKVKAAKKRNSNDDSEKLKSKKKFKNEEDEK